LYVKTFAVEPGRRLGAHALRDVVADGAWTLVADD
jgi:hypothetical protein